MLNSISLAAFLYPLYSTDLTGANPTSLVTVPLQRGPADRQPTFMQLSSTYFCLAVTLNVFIQCRLNQYTKLQLLTELDTKGDEKTGKYKGCRNVKGYSK